MTKIKLFTAPGCASCQELKLRLDLAGIKYHEYDTSTKEGLAEWAEFGQGNSKSPLLVVGDRVVANYLEQLDWIYTRMKNAE